MLRTRQELSNARSSLWKLRTKENKLKETDAVKEIKLMDKNLEHVTKLLEKQKLRLLDRDKNIRKAIKNDENKIKKQEILTEVWATYRWITKYLTNTTEAWEKEKLEREQEYNSRITEWTSMTRAEKIQTILTENKQDTTNKVRTDLSWEVTKEIVENLVSQAENKIIMKEILESIIQEVENKIRNKRRTIIKQPVLKLIKEPEITSTKTQTKILKYLKPNYEIRKSPPKTTTIKNSSQEHKEKSKEHTVYENNTPQNTPSSKTPQKILKLKQETPKSAKVKKNEKTPKITKRKTVKQQEEQKTVKQLRCFWTAYAKKQKEKSESSGNYKEQNKKMSDMNTENSQCSIRTDFVLEASPNSTIADGPRSRILEPSISEKKTCTPVQARINQFEKRKCKSNTGTT